MSREATRSAIKSPFSRFLSTALMLGALIALPLAALDTLASDAPQPPTSLPIDIYTYHDKPPYYTLSPPSSKSFRRQNLRDPEQAAQGLYPLFIDLVNRAQQHYHLTLKHLPRKRIQLQLQQNALIGAVIGVNPIWFKDQKRVRYLWSPAFMLDQDIIVVRNESTLDYKSLTDLVGVTFALPRGYYFYGITELAQKGDLSIIETSSDLQNLKLVQYGRADATITSKPTMSYFQQSLFQYHQFRTLEKPHDRFSRHWMFPLAQAELFDQLSSAISEVTLSEQWKQALSVLDADAPTKEPQQPK